MAETLSQMELSGWQWCLANGAGGRVARFWREYKGGNGITRRIVVSHGGGSNEENVTIAGRAACSAWIELNQRKD